MHFFRMEKEAQEAEARRVDVIEWIGCAADVNNNINNNINNINKGASCSFYSISQLLPI